MKTVFKLIFGGVVLAALASTGASAAGLLDGVVGSNGLLGNNGLVGGLTNGLLGGTGGSTGVSGVATVNTSTPPAGGANVGATLLGGGGGTIQTNLGGLLGDSSGVSVNLPNLNGLLGGGGNGGNGDGGNGNTGGGGITINLPPSNGLPGTGGGGGIGGGNNGSYPSVYYASVGGAAGSFAIPDGVSPRLRLLLKILADRDWLQLSNGQALCLSGYGTAHVNGWLPNKDWPAFQRVLANYSQDIGTLRQLLANCHNPGLTQASLNSVIGLDIRKDGSPVLFML